MHLSFDFFFGIRASVCQSSGELGCVKAPAWNGHEVFQLRREEGLRARGNPQALSFPFSACRTGCNSAGSVRTQCPLSPCQSPWPSCSLPMRCRNPTPKTSLPKLPPSMAHEGCSRTSWAAAQRGQCPCLFANAPCTKDTLLAKNSLWVYMCWLNKS